MKIVALVTTDCGDVSVQLFVNSSKLEAYLTNDLDWLSDDAICHLMDRERIELESGWMEVRDLDVFSF